MRKMIFCCITLLLFLGCKKQQEGSRVDIYLLKSFTISVDQSTVPVTLSITNAVLESLPLVHDQEIKFYSKDMTTFTLRKDIQSIIKNYGADKAFAVTVDHQPIYYGQFHPLHLSSIAFGVATIAPLLYRNEELKIDFAAVQGNLMLQQLDKRNDSRLLNALNETGRLR